MPDLSPAASTWLAEHHGVVTTGQLRNLGVGRPTIRRLVDHGVLRVVTRGVFTLASAPSTLEQRCAELSASYSGFVTGPTAGSLAGLRRMPRASSLHFSVLHGVHLPERHGVTWRQTTVIWSIDRRTRRDGIVVASWSRLAFDLAADLPALDHVSVVSQLLHERKVTQDELVAIDKRLGHPARPGSGKFRRTLSAIAGASPGQSHPEIVLAKELHARDVPAERQVPVTVASGLTFHLDLGVADVRWGVELDIHPEHRTVEGHAADARRRRELHRADWQVEVVTEREMHDPAGLARDLAGLFHIRRRRFGDHPSVEGPDSNHSALG